MTDTRPGRQVPLGNLHVSLIREAERAQEFTDKYVSELKARFRGLEDQLKALNKEIRSIHHEQDEIKSLIDTTLDKAHKKYESTMATIIRSLNIEMPCQTAFHFDDHGNPITLVVFDSDDKVNNS